MFKKFAALYALVRQDARILWHALRHPARPAWLRPAVALVASQAASQTTSLAATLAVAQAAVLAAAQAATRAADQAAAQAASWRVAAARRRSSYTSGPQTWASSAATYCP